MDRSRQPKVLLPRRAGAYIIRLPRYEAFTKTALALLDSGVRFTDVAGNDDMLVTVVTPAAFDERGIRNAGVASRPILTDPQRTRLALLVPGRPPA